MSYVINPLVAWLLSHAYGQGGSVAVPASGQSQVPRGQFPAGIDDVLMHLCERYLAWSPADGNEIDWCFLVGGPGNGKSESLRLLAELLNVQLPAPVLGQPVPRVVPTTWPGSAQALASGLEIAFINDASIPRAGSLGSGTPGSLFQDITDGLQRLNGSGVPVAIFGNVNRGILIEEAGSLRGSHASLLTPVGRAATEIVRALAGLPLSVDGGASSGSVTTLVPINPLSPHYAQFGVSIAGTNRQIKVHAIYLDVLSLLEPRPGADQPVVDFSSAPPTVAEYHTLGSLVSKDISRDTTTAGRLVKEFALPQRWAGSGCKDPATGSLCEAHATCPFAQNAKWLQEDTLRHRFLDALRGAEVAAGRRFTYRDLLGHISLAILGTPEEDWLKQTHPCDWSRNERLAISSGEKAVAARLSSHRIYTNLFACAEIERRSVSEQELRDNTVYGQVKSLLGGGGEKPRLQAFETAFQEIDPARDTETWNGTRGKALDVVESLDVLAPSEQIVHWQELPGATHSEIETMLDHVLREEIASELERGSRASGNRVRALRRWRSNLMLRQVGMALGNLSFGVAIQAWLAEQENALRQGQRMQLGDGIHNLIIPSDNGGRIFLAPLRPRTYCLSRELPPDTLLVSITTTDLNVVIVPHGDTLIAEVQINRARERFAPAILASLVIDLSVAREAILHAEGDARSFTEIGYTAFARIERARASLISRERMKSTPVHFTDATEKLYRLSGNPGGSIPLRVQTA